MSALESPALGPLPLAPGDLQFFSSVHPAETPKGLRLLQIDTEVHVTRAKSAPSRDLTHCQPTPSEFPEASLAYPVAAFVALCDVTPAASALRVSAGRARPCGHGATQLSQPPRSQTLALRAMRH